MTRTPSLRTHSAGTLRAEHVGQTVTLAGWVGRRRDHGGVAFLDLREASGVVQVVVRDEEIAHQLRNEFCIKVTGEVVARTEENVNPNLATGEIEVVAQTSRSSPPPQRSRSPSTITSRSARTYVSSTVTSTCAAPRPATRSGCVPRSTRRSARCSTSATSSRSRPRP